MTSKSTYLTPEVARTFSKANHLRAEGRLLEAETVLRTLATAGDARQFALEALADVYARQGRREEARNTLLSLTQEQPDNVHYAALYANHLDGEGLTQAAIDEYSRLLARQPSYAVAWYNVALLHTKMKQYQQAIGAYEKAVELNIERVEEVYSNMGVLYSDMQEPELAMDMFQRALDIDASYLPALFNRAGHLEESDQKDLAIESYEHILSIDATHWKSLARLAYPRKISDDNRNIVARLRDAVAVPKDNPLEQEGLYFALGKAFDDLQEYDNATDAYNAANRIGKQRSHAYNRQVTEAGFLQLIEMFDANWIENHATNSKAMPIFVCGMFRSGSTLLEQMLGAHSAVTAGGELEILPWLVGSRLAPFPNGVRDATCEQLRDVGEDYLSRACELYPGHEHLTDKRPDNYLHLGLIKALFPLAKIIHTRRGLLDNCLSLYFQQLGNSFAYSTDIEDTAHYVLQHDRLMAHWKSCLGSDVFTVQYEDLVVSPEPVMRSLLEYLGLEWDAAVLEFRRGAGVVKTPSLWQVREKLHTRSCERWRNYAALVEPIRKLCVDEGRM